MIECPIPQDILKFKSKFIAGFSGREVTFLMAGAGAALAMFFKILDGTAMETMTKIYISAFCAIPFFLFGFAKPLGQPLEKVLIQIVVDNFLAPPMRPYEIRRPQFEAFSRGHESFSQNKEEGKKKGKSKKNSKEIKIAKSKEYKAIR